MPRDGSGSSDNAVELDPAAGNPIIHDSGSATSEVDRSSKAAPLPTEEKGEAIEGMNASGGGNTAKGSGKGPAETQ